MKRIIPTNLFHSTYYTTLENSGTPQILTFHDTIYEDFPSYFSADLTFKAFMTRKKRCVEAASHIIAVSHATKERLIHHYTIAPEQISVIHHGLSNEFHLMGDTQRALQHKRLQKGSSSPSFLRSKPFLLFVGGRRHYKNFLSLLKAFGLSRIHNDFNLVVVGSEKTLYDDERRIINRFNLSEKVKLIGFVDFQTLLSIYSKASGFVFPTLAEGFGLPLLEAMACNVPVACSNIPIFQETAANVPIYFDPCSLESMIDAIEKMVSKSVYQNLKKGKARSLTFQWDDAIKKMVNIYTSALS